MHTDSTLELLDSVTIRLGKQFRHFTNKICPQFETKELKRETEARQRRQRKKMESQEDRVKTKSTSTFAADPDPKRKKFHLRFIKYHFLGDHADEIREFGTSDSFSTEPESTYSFA